MKHGNRKERHGLDPLRLRGPAGDSVRQDNGNNLSKGGQVANSKHDRYLSDDAYIK